MAVTMTRGHATHLEGWGGGVRRGRRKKMRGMRQSVMVRVISPTLHFRFGFSPSLSGNTHSHLRTHRHTHTHTHLLTYSLTHLLTYSPCILGPGVRPH